MSQKPIFFFLFAFVLAFSQNANAQSGFPTTHPARCIVQCEVDETECVCVGLFPNGGEIPGTRRTSPIPPGTSSPNCLFSPAYEASGTACGEAYDDWKRRKRGIADPNY